MSSNGVPRLSEDDRVLETEFDQEFGLNIDCDPDEEAREIVEKTEEPGMDSLRGTFGAIGTIIRAKRRARALSAASAARTIRSSMSIHSQTQEGIRQTSTGSRPGWLSGRWSSHQGSRFAAVSEDQDIEKGKVEVVTVEADEKRQRADSAYSEPRSPSAGVISASPTAIPLRSLQSHSTLHSDKDTTISEDTTKPIFPRLDMHDEHDDTQ